MQSFHDSVSQVLQSNVDFLSDKVSEASALNPFSHGGAVDSQSVRQLVEGLLHIIDEGLEGESKEIREAYTETVIPNLVRRGRNPASLTYSAITFVVAASTVLARELSDSERAPALAWFAHFFAVFQADLNMAAQKALAER